MSRDLEEPRSIELRLVDAERNARRYYAIMVGPTLYYPNAMVVVRGRLGSPMRRRTEEFVTAAQLASKWRLLVATRRRHGYVEIVAAPSAAIASCG